MIINLKKLGNFLSVENFIVTLLHCTTPMIVLFFFFLFLCDARWFRENGNLKLSRSLFKNGLLFHLHIPKTGGTSFGAYMPSKNEKKKYLKLNVAFFFFLSVVLLGGGLCLGFPNRPLANPRKFRNGLTLLKDNHTCSVVSLEASFDYVEVCILNVIVYSKKILNFLKIFSFFCFFARLYVAFEVLLPLLLFYAILSFI